MRVHCAEFDITAPTGRNGIEQLIDVIAGQTASLHRSSPSDTLSCRWHDFRGPDRAFQAAGPNPRWLWRRRGEPATAHGCR